MSNEEFETEEDKYMAEFKCQQAMYSHGDCMAFGCPCMKSECPLEAWEEE